LRCSLLGGDSRIEQEPTIAADLCEWLGYLPLGIKLVGKFLKIEPDLAIGTLLAQLQTEKLKHDGLMSIDAVFELSWEKIAAVEQQLAVMLSLFAVAPIAWSLVEAGVSRCRVEPAPPGFWQRWQWWGRRPEESPQWCLLLEPKALVRGRRRLVELSLLQHLGAEQYQLHPLIREFFALKWAQRPDREELAGAVWDGVLSAAESSTERPARSVLAETNLVLPHLQVAIARRETAGQATEVALGIAWLAELYKAQGRYAEAEPLYARSLQIYEQKLGADHPHTATSLNNLALLYKSQGRYGEAEPLYARSLQIYEQKLGADHPHTAQSLNNLAGLYESQGRYGEAEPLYARSLQIHELQLGADHPHTAQSLNNLAGLYESQGRYSEAEPLLARSLQICELQLGADHPDTAQSLNNLAGLYRSQGRYGEAEPLLARSLQICEQQLGADHPLTALSLNNLAVLYANQGRFTEAEPLLVKALALRQVMLGDQHPHTVGTRQSLAILRQMMAAGS
jgi:tetratricopeptide (TPR) repeat protein